MNLAPIKALLPVLVDLGVSMLNRFGGDVEAAKREIKRIADHGTGFVDAEKAARAEIEKAKGR